MSKKCRAYSESKLGLEPSDNRKSFYAGWEAALAEPQSTHSDECWRWHHECAIARIEETEELREALKAALAESEKLSKPVAWMHTNGVGHVYFRKKPQDKVFNPQPVYLHPKTLTDEDISVLWHQSGEQPFKFARMLLK